MEQQQTDDHRQRPVESSPASTSCAHRRTTPRTYQRPRKRRSVFSRMQVYRLEFAFNVKQYLSSSERAALARELALTQMQVPLMVDRDLTLFLSTHCLHLHVIKRLILDSVFVSMACKAHLSTIQLLYLDQSVVSKSTKQVEA